jgi:hypothetical protein
MSTLDRSGTTARRALWFVGLLVLLVGIVAMHGLNSHGGGMDPVAHGIVVHDPGAASADSGHDVMAAAFQDLAGPVAAMGAAVAAGESGMGAGMAGMCMAVLALALTALLRMLGNAPALPLYRLVGAPVLGPGPHGRHPDPPSLINLSIRRC